jgi:lysyl-tRNA synthetase class I
MRDTWISRTPCPKCGSKVLVTEIDEIHGDIRYECCNSACDYHGYEEGPDY